ncbi:uncharacterized protein [Aegilops tauschii subsp. strangulata]|uniref:uncharacterized protein n=1 Tax=Aegilops tauschii subsp. strangulata TaxID=200361 RepID=UPI003CC8CC96
MGKSSTTPVIPESEEQVLVTPDANTEQDEEHHDDRGDPPPQTEKTASDAMDADANPAGNPDPPSSIPSSPLEATEETPPEKNDDDVAIIGAGYKTPGITNLLTKHTTKEEKLLSEKGKSKLELSGYEGLNAEDLHAGYVSRLVTSRDMEASLVNTMKRSMRKHYLWPTQTSPV